MKLLPRKYVTIKGVKFYAADLKKNNCAVCASENKLSSYYGLIENVFDYGEEIICKVSKLHSGIEYVQIDLISLNTNDDNFKRTSVKTNHYTDNYIKRDNKKHVTGRTLKWVSEVTVKQLFNCGKKKLPKS